MQRRYRFSCWADDQWGMLHAQLTQMGLRPERHPVLFYAGFVPLTTWLRHPSWGIESVRRDVKAIQPEKETKKWSRS